MRLARLGDLGSLVLERLISSGHGAIGGQQNAQRPRHCFPAARKNLVDLGAIAEHASHITRAWLRKLARLALQFVEQVKRLARAQGV